MQDNFLSNLRDGFTFGFFGEGFIIGPETNTIEQLCAQIENAAEELGIPLSDELIDFLLSGILGEGFYFLKLRYWLNICWKQE